MCRCVKRMATLNLFWCCQTYHTTKSTKCLCVFMALPAKEGSVLHYCRIREDFGLLGVDIWLKLCQSIGRLSGIDRCLERPNCLVVFQSTRLHSMKSVHHYGCTDAFKRLLISAVSLPPLQHILCIYVWIPYIYFPELGATFTAAQLFPLCDSPSVTHR